MKESENRGSENTGRIFITGDKHGSFIPFFGLHERGEMKDTDILIIAGDAGYVWDDDYIYKVETLSQLFPGTVAFIDGNHENHDILDAMDVVTWHGGKAHIVGERVMHLMRGEIYSICGCNIFTFGGARSNDKDRRTEGESWWRQEEPDREEMEYGRRQLMENIDDIDYVITHESPLFARDHISRSKEVDDDYLFPEVLEEWYELVSKGERFQRWYFGHMHEDRVITPKLRGVHNDILRIGEDTQVRWA